MRGGSTGARSSDARGRSGNGTNQAGGFVDLDAGVGGDVAHLVRFLCDKIWWDSIVVLLINGAISEYVLRYTPVSLSGSLMIGTLLNDLCCSLCINNDVVAICRRASIPSVTVCLLASCEICSDSGDSDSDVTNRKIAHQ